MPYHYQHARRQLVALLLLLTCLTTATAQPRCRLMEFEEFNAASGSVSRIVRDAQGMMWFATRDGLFRYDGYEFRGFKSHSGDGTNMSSNRIANMYASSEGGLWCHIDERAFLFDLRTCRFIDVMAQLEREKGRSYNISKIRALSCGTTFLFTDDGLIFAIDDARPQHSARLLAEGEDFGNLSVACDADQRAWVLTSHHTYMYDHGRLTRFDETFRRSVNCGQTLWLQTTDGQLARYDEQQRSIRRWASPLLAQPVSWLTPLADGSLVVHTAQGLLYLKAGSRQLQKTGIDWPVRKILQDKHERLWLLGQDGRLALADKSCTTVTVIPGVRMDDCYLHADKYGTLWFFTNGRDIYQAPQASPTQLQRYELAESPGGISNSIADGQGGCWFINKERAYRMTFEAQPYSYLPLQQAGQVRSTGLDSQRRLLVGTRNDETVTVFSDAGQRLGWLAPDGHLSTTPVSFGAAVYAIYKDRKGVLWLGSKRNGLFRLKNRPDGSFLVTQYQHSASDNATVSDNEVYGFAEDPRGRLWIATRRGGLCVLEKPEAEQLRFLHAGNGLRCWTADLERGVQTLLCTASGQLLVGTQDGLYVADANADDPTAMSFRRHSREADRAESLSSRAVTSLCQTRDGRIFIGTEGGGVNELLSDNPLGAELRFRHYDSSTGVPADITRAMAEADGSLYIATADRLVEMRLKTGPQPDINSLLVRNNPWFAVATPTPLADGQWVFGTDKGAVVLDLKRIKGCSFVPPLVVTGVSVENRPIDYAAQWNDTIALGAKERSLTLWFSALDYEENNHIAYAYRIGDDSRPWTYTGENHSLALAQLKPGTYRLAIRSTNSDGVWCNNLRTVTIIVRPSFWETPWAVLLVVLIIGAMAAAVISTWLYIRRINRHQRETMEAYLALLEKHGQAAPTAQPAADDAPEGDQGNAPHVPPLITEEEDELMKRIVTYIEENLGNSDVTIDDIASAVAVSRTSLHRKMKSLVGTSPMEFLREARLRKATQMLEQTSKPVSEIAYLCGFSDPKYFSKCFKAATGMTPTEFKHKK